MGLRHSVPPHNTDDHLYMICSHMACRLKQCVAVRYCTHLASCSVLQCVAVCCSVLQCVMCVRRVCSRKRTSKSNGTHMHKVCSSMNGSGHTERWGAGVVTHFQEI